MGNKRQQVQNVVAGPTCPHQLQPSAQVLHSIDITAAAHFYQLWNFRVSCSPFALRVAKALKAHFSKTGSLPESKNFHQ